MIRQLRWLTRPLPAAGPTALALAVYAEARDNQLKLRAAAEQGFEGVACVDDAARAIDLYCTTWRSFRLPWARQAAENLLSFLLYLQDEQGRFINFVLSWHGQPNLTGRSSVPGGTAWTARAMQALATACATFGDQRYADAFERGLPWLDQPTPWLDVRAVHVLTALEYSTVSGSAGLRRQVLAWAEEIAASRLGDLLPDVAGRPQVHLWNHHQEVALARVGRAFDRADLVEYARHGVEAVFVPTVDNAFRERSTTLPYDVSCAVRALDAVAETTGQARYARLAEQARAWFDGRNAAGAPLYDRDRGLVHDGLDGTTINPNSGAESNIEGALALFDKLPWQQYGNPDPRCTLD
jgi:hypothetical protein